jgi:hypothetical protein
VVWAPFLLVLDMLRLQEGGQGIVNFFNRIEAAAYDLVFSINPFYCFIYPMSSYC